MPSCSVRKNCFRPGARCLTQTRTSHANAREKERQRLRARARKSERENFAGTGGQRLELALAALPPPQQVRELRAWVVEKRKVLDRDPVGVRVAFAVAPRLEKAALRLLGGIDRSGVAADLLLLFLRHLVEQASL